MTTPFELEQIRQEEAAKAEKQSAQASQKTVDATLIQDATPEDQKLKGKNKLPILLFTLGSKSTVYGTVSIVEKYTTSLFSVVPVGLESLFETI